MLTVLIHHPHIRREKEAETFFHAVEVKSLWSTSSIRDILNDEVYLGKLIWNKTKKRIGSNNTSSYVPKDEWMVIENCHEPIITQELFDMGTRLIQKNVFVQSVVRETIIHFIIVVCVAEL